MSHKPPSRVDLLQGTLDLLILKTLSWGPRHGYAVASWIRETTNQRLQIEEGALYTALHRNIQDVFNEYTASRS
jgi:DNA-binding PadR family transcriptional regulator